MPSLPHQTDKSNLTPLHRHHFCYLLDRHLLKYNHIAKQNEHSICLQKCIPMPRAENVQNDFVLHMYPTATPIPNPNPTAPPDGCITICKYIHKPSGPSHLFKLNHFFLATHETHSVETQQQIHSTEKNAKQQQLLALTVPSRPPLDRQWVCAIKNRAVLQSPLPRCS